MAHIVLPTSYSAVQRNDANERSRSWLLARFSFALILVAFTLLAFTSHDNRPEAEILALEASDLKTIREGKKPANTQSLIQPDSETFGGHDISSSSTGGSSETIPLPTAQDVAEFDSKAGEVLQSIGLTMANVADKTGLDETCGDMLQPCVATVGSCILCKMEADNGHLFVDPEACQCFAEGMSKPIPFPSLPEAKLTCSLPCLEALSATFQDHLRGVNGDADASVTCPRVFMNLARRVFGGAGDEFPVADADDGEEVDPVESARVVRAGAAFVEHINLVRKTECPLKPQYPPAPEILFDERGLAAYGRGQYRLEVRVGEDVYTGRVVHLPKLEQMAEVASSTDPDELLTRFRVMRMRPDPCAAGPASQLAVTRASVAAVNGQKLAWRAGLGAGMEGRTVEAMGMGDVALSQDVRRARTVTLAVDNFTPPASYDARDFSAEGSRCRAYEVLDQGSCGSCYAFAAAAALSARMCRATGGKWDVVLSPQEMMDCNNGCNGGSAYYVYDHLAGEGTAVENFCDPYTEEASECGGACAAGNKFDALADSVYRVGGGGAGGVKAMQKELLAHGPGVVSFTVYSDFFAYESGVYTKSVGEDAEPAGRHAVALVGWGTDNGEDYWRCQNSWGADWGEGGTFRIRRGTNEVGIEDGMTVTTPEEPSVCPDTVCAHGGVAMRDCACRCNGGWGGPSCEECPVTCHNGGVLDGCVCQCPPGTSGPDCSGLVSVSPPALCSSSAESFTAELTFGGASNPPTQKSFLGLYPEGTVRSMSYVAMEYVCGSTYDHSVHDGLCPTSGSVTLPKPSSPGTYEVALIKWLPLNEFDQDGWVGHVENVVARVTVTSDCSVAGLAAAAASSDLSASWRGAETERAAARERARSEMDARLSAAAEALQALESQPEPSLSIGGVEGAGAVVFAGAPLSVCWVVPGSLNFHPKHLILYVGGPASTSFYKSGLSDFGPDAPAPDAPAGCVDSAIAPWMPEGAYTVMLKHTESRTLIAASPTFQVARAWVGVARYSWRTAPPAHVNKNVELTIQWKLTGTPGSVSDTVRVLDSRGDVFDWFYTSCACKGKPAAQPAAEGSVVIEMVHSAGIVTGGYTVKFYPNGGDLVAAEAWNWVPWADLGW